MTVLLVDENIQEVDPKSMPLKEPTKSWIAGFRVACRKMKSAINEVGPEVMDSEGKSALDKLWKEADRLEVEAIAEAPTLIVSNNTD